MKKITLALLAFQFIGLISCKDELAPQPVSIYKGSIVNFLTEIRDKNDAYISGIQEVENGIDFKTIKIYDLITTEKLLIGDLSPLNKFQNADRSKVLFFLNNNEIVRSLIVTFEGTSKNSEYDLAVISILNMRGSLPNYSGKVSFYSIFQKLMLFNVYKDGKLSSNGIVRKFHSGKNNGRTNACTDWYLVTTYHYADGSTQTEEFYLGTTCDEPCGFAGARVNCGGGGGGGTVIPTTQFPQNPNNGDIYETTDRDGVYTKYQWDNYKQLWIGIMRILPVFVLQDNPSLYPFLRVRNPVDGRVIFSPDDNMAYTYNAGSGSWVGELPEFVLPGIDNLAIEIEKFLNCFGSDQAGGTYKISLFVLEPNPGTGAEKTGFNVGHTFVGLTKTVNGTSITQYIGFYPKYRTTSYPTDSKIESNDNYRYTTSVTYDVSANDFYSAISTALTRASNQYDISQYNCTTYALDVCDAAGIQLPRTFADFPYNYGRGLSPGNLGADLRSRSVIDNRININGGTSGNGNGPCQ